jgi:hypothetical protein
MGRLAQRKSTGLTSRGSQVRILYRPPLVLAPALARIKNGHEETVVMSLPPSGQNGATAKENFSVAIWLILAIAAAAGGIIFFIILFIPDFNMYWLVFAPIILAFYEMPAVFFFWLYKKKKAALHNPDKEEEV